MRKLKDLFLNFLSHSIAFSYACTDLVVNSINTSSIITFFTQQIMRTGVAGTCGIDIKDILLWKD